VLLGEEKWVHWRAKRGLKYLWRRWRERYRDYYSFAEREIQEGS
jgi:hypothetical protein